jgi:nitrilase
MPTIGNRLSVAVIQTEAGRDTARNLARIRELAAAAPEADLIALPEVFAFRGGDADYRARGEPIPGPLTEAVAALARARRAWVLAGSIIEKADGRFFNTSVLISRSGQVTAVYRKIHLFEAHLDNGQTIRERDVYEEGREPVLADIEGWRGGLAVCYDLRFPELFRHYARGGATLLFIPSNFTQRTGKDHWEVLVRARAIENQCFVVAPNQCGSNPVSGIASYGHSLIVGPWGEVLAEAGDAETVLQTELDRSLLDQTRKRIPALNHRRLGC